MNRIYIYSLSEAEKKQFLLLMAGPLRPYPPSPSPLLMARPLREELFLRLPLRVLCIISSLPSICIPDLFIKMQIILLDFLSFFKSRISLTAKFSSGSRLKNEILLYFIFKKQFLAEKCIPSPLSGRHIQ